MANRESDWQGLLEGFNETLAPQGKVILVEQNEDESTYSISVSMPNGKKELYADNYYEDELCNLLPDVLAWASNYTGYEEDITKSEPEKVIVLSVIDSDCECYLLRAYKGKRLADIEGKDLIPALRAFADDDGFAEEFESEDDLKKMADILAANSFAESDNDYTYELHYVELTTF